MEAKEEKVFEGIFAVEKPAFVSAIDVIRKLQSTFASSETFALLCQHQPKRPSKDSLHTFRMGHGGTLDLIAYGVMIIGIGRGTKQLQDYLACSKTYETAVLFGASTDTLDYTGAIQKRSSTDHVTQALVEEKLRKFSGTIQQTPPIYSALKVNGIKACEYARQGKELPRQLESREVYVDECTLIEFYEQGQHCFALPGENTPALGPVAVIRLKVSSGFYVRSFAHDLGIACQSSSYTTTLGRTHQANFTIKNVSDHPELLRVLTFADLDAGEDVWGAKLRPQLEKWMDMNPIPDKHVNGRDKDTKQMLAAGKEARPKQRFRGEWVAETKKERIKQQGGKFKGKWNRDPPLRSNTTGQDP